MLHIFRLFSYKNNWQVTTAGTNLKGIVLLQELPHLSHLGVRARQVSFLHLMISKSLQDFVMDVLTIFGFEYFPIGEGCVCDMWRWWCSFWHTKAFREICEVVLSSLKMKLMKISVLLHALWVHLFVSFVCELKIGSFFKWCQYKSISNRWFWWWSWKKYF